MDERHWWIAIKVQETFQIGGREDNPAELEEVFLQPENLQLINEFLQAAGHQTLFFFAEAGDKQTLTKWDLRVIPDLLRSQELPGRGKGRNPSPSHTLLYFLRPETGRAVDPLRIERDVFCGEIKDNPIENLSCLLISLIFPILRARRDWGCCSQESVTHFLSGLDKYAAAIQDIANATNSEKQQILKRPRNIVSIDFLQQRSAILDSDIVSENETLVSEWIKTIDLILMETVDERVLDINTTPLTELDWWRRRQKLFSSITEQLRGRECKTVIALLIFAKSRLLKKWKALDISITDAANATKDRVKYLEMLHRHFEAMGNENNPVNLINNILPSLFTAIRQMDSISRFFSRNGFLGLLLTKVSNQLAQSCRQFIRECIMMKDPEDGLWEKVREHIENEELVPPQKDTQENKLKRDKNKGIALMGKNTLHGWIDACLELHIYFQDAVRQLRERLSGTHGMHQYASSSSISTIQGKQSSVHTSKTSRLFMKKTSSVTSSYDHQHDYQGTGVAITDEDTVMYHLDTLCRRLKQFWDIILKLHQYKMLSEQTEGIRKPYREDITEEETSETGSVSELTGPEEHVSIGAVKNEVPPYPAESFSQRLNDLPLHTLVEEDEIQSSAEGSVHPPEPTGREKDSELHSYDPEPLAFVKPDKRSAEDEGAELKLSNEEKQILADLFNWEDLEDDGPILSLIIKEKLNQMIDTLAQTIDTDVLLDIERRERNPFEEGYSEFLVMNQQLERYLSIYVQALFLRRMQAKEALSILQRFSVVSHRQGIQPVINECYVEVFDWFSEELKVIQEIYETFKDDPVIPRNMPPVTGAIFWSRQLLSRIEDVMKLFRDVRLVVPPHAYTQTVKLYNRIAKALVSYEAMWYQKWKTNVDKGLAGFNVTLLVRNPFTQQLMVNTDMRILQVIEETKWMMRFGIQIPEAAMLAFKQGEKFKLYRSHLEGMLQEYEQLQKNIPRCLTGLFTRHLEAMNHQFHPGLSALSWNSINIEGFLHQATAAVARLRSLVQEVSDIIEQIIEATLQKMASLDLFPASEVFTVPKSPAELVELIMSSVMNRKSELQVMATIVKDAISNVISTIKNAKIGVHGTGQNAAHVKAAITRSYPQLHQTLRSRQQGTLSSSVHSISDYSEEITDTVLEHFCKQIYQAVYMSICRALLLLAQVAGCDMDAITRDTMTPFGKTKISSSDTSTQAIGTDTLKGASKTSPFVSSLPEMIMGNSRRSHVLRFKLMVIFKIPNIVIDPSVEVAQDAVKRAALAIISMSDSLSWWSGESKGTLFLSSISEDETIQHILSHISEVMIKLMPSVSNHVFHWSQYDFLWKDDLKRQWKEFLAASCDPFLICKELERVFNIEQEIEAFKEVSQVGCCCLDFSLIKETLKGFAGAWKFQYAAVLHQEVKKNLTAAVKYREEAHQKLTVPVQTLEQLNSSLGLSEELQDMENKIDGVYRPIEDMYEQLRLYQIQIPRQEMTDVKHLRDKWTELMQLAHDVKETLIKTKQDVFKQELDKQVKSFVVEVIQFRNSFDTHGPTASGVRPEEAVSRLHDFQEKFQVYDAKRKTLNSVQRLFNVIPKKFPELDRTEKDLQSLGTLYNLFQKFIDFDQRFRNTLWAEVKLKESNKEIEEYASECLVWDDKLKDWDAYNEMAGEIKIYEDVFPLLHKLAVKGIRNRHWLQVMAITGSNFPLEANVFKVSHLLDIGLLKFQDQLISVTKAANKELELEIKMRKVEEEWTEQVLNFEAYKNRGPISLVKEESLLLLEELENAQILMAQMLMSKEIDPLREEANLWAEKLKRAGDVLELWVEVQELWHCLEEIFSHSSIIKELPQEARRFARVDRSWVRMMRMAYKTKNVLQCCCAGDAPKEVILKHVQQELEVCFRSLGNYLERVRQAFPRFYLLSDLALLSLLSQPNDAKHLRHHLRSLFSGVCEIGVEVLEDEKNESPDEELEQFLPIPDSMSVRSGNDGWLSFGQRSRSHMTDSETIVQRSLKSPGVSQEGNHPTLYRAPIKGMTAVSVTAGGGEILHLDEQVAITSEVKIWLDKLRSSVFRTMESNISSLVQEVDQATVEEWIQKYPAQVAVLALFYSWTKDCEAAIAEAKMNHKALPGARKSYLVMCTRLSGVVSKGTWKNSEEPITQCHRLKLENMIMHILYLCDIMERLTASRIQEVTDFDWKRAMRLYLKEQDGLSRPAFNILDAQYEYGCEFYGAGIPLILNPVTEKCFFIISQTLQQENAVALQGDHGVGKTETIKGLSYLLGKFLFIFTCCTHVDATALCQVLQGTALDGCWSCFDDFHLLSKDATSVFMLGAQIIYDALKAKIPTCTLFNGQEIAVDMNCSLFLTVHWRPGFQKLPRETLALFRMVALVVPDLAVLLRRKLSSLVFKSPKVLAQRLQLISDLVKEQLPEKCHHHVSLQCLLGVISRAGQKREGEKVAKALLNRMGVGNDGEKISRSDGLTSTQQYPAHRTTAGPGVKARNSRDRKKMSSNPGVAAAKESHAIMVEALQEVLGPRMVGNSLAVFKQIVRDVFAGAYDPSEIEQASQNDLERAIAAKVEENHLFCHLPWVNKIKQLFSLALVHPGIIVAGPPGSGKSMCISVLLQALSLLPSIQQEEALPGADGTAKVTAHKLVKINPFSADSVASMFGTQTSSRLWVDGIVTYVWRRAMRSHSNTWICFDGPLSSSWADNFSSVLGPEKVLQLSNGDSLRLTENMKLLFETNDLELASPATITKAGILYIEGEALGWTPLAKTWLEGRNQQENTVLSKAFYKILDPIFSFVLQDAKPLVPVTEVGLFSTCANLLAAMLNDKAQSIGGQLHIERLFIFCLIWSVGGLLEGTEKRKFNELLKVYTSVLPDYDHEISVFDYYVDESGEWETWQSCLPEMTYIGSTDVLGEVFVETLDTIMVRTFLEYASMGSQHILLIGPPGSGKTAMINDFISTQDKSQTLIKRMVFSGSSRARDLQQLIGQNIVHRQGFIYGARDGKTFQLFVDDLNLPQPDENNVQCCNELLRLLLDDKVLVKPYKPFEWQSLQGLVVQAAMSLREYASSTPRTFNQRLLRHFAIFHLPVPEGLQLHQVIFSVLEANMGDKDGLPLAEELHTALVRASCRLLKAVKKVLIPSGTPGRQHYLFSLRDINKAFQCLRRLSNEDREDSTTVISFWQHEIQRILEDRLCRQADQNWFNSELNQIITENFSDIPLESLRKHFITFPLENKFSHQASAGNLNKGIKVLLQCTAHMPDVKRCLQTYLQHYNEELGNQKLQLDLSKNVIDQIIRIHRILAYENSGNILLVGTVGSHLRTLARLALYVADVLLHSVDPSGESNFINSLKLAVQMCAVEGKATAILLRAQDLVKERFLDAINSLLIGGEYPPLFSTEEMNDLLQVLGPVLRRKHPHLEYDPVKYLVSQVKSKLHIIVCLPPHHNLLKTASEKYPGFLYGCQMIWIDNWSEETICDKVRHNFARQKILEMHTEETREKVVEAISLIHRHMLQVCNQIPWVGGHGDKMSMTCLEKGSEKTDTVEKMDQSDFPYSKEIIQERLQLLNPEKTNNMRNESFLGPSTLQIFLDNFTFIYLRKRAEQEDLVRKLKTGLGTLAQTRRDAKVTQETVSRLGTEFTEAKITVADILNKLITKASAVERLKAVLGRGDETLQVFLSQHDADSEDDEEIQDLLKEDDLDEYDEAFYHMKEVNSRSFVHEINEKLETARSELEAVRNNLKHAKNQVMHWCSKVDKGCVERLIHCQNPPYLVAQILEMVLVLTDFIPKTTIASDSHRTPRYPVESTDERAISRIPAAQLTKQAQRKQIKGRDSKDKVDKIRWKSLQNCMGDSSKFVEMIHYVAELEDGLPDQTLKDVEAYLGKAREGSQGVTGEGSLLENAAPYATPQSIAPAKKFVHPDNAQTRDPNKGGITIAAARYSSEDAATLVAFVVATVEYTRLCEPLKRCLIRVADLEKEKEDRNMNEQATPNEAESAEEDLTMLMSPEPSAPAAEDLSTLQSEVQQLQAQYNLAVVHKHTLEEELCCHQERLQAALDVLESLRTQEQDWKRTVEESSLPELLTNCLMAAAFLTYCSALSVDARNCMMAFLFKVCESCSLPIPTRVLLKDVTLAQFLHTPIERKKLEMKGLPRNRLALDNSCVLTAADGNGAWILVCDPTAQAVPWIEDHLSRECAQVQYHELCSQLDSCLTDGRQLLLTYCDVEMLAGDARLTQILRSKSEFQQNKVPFKMMVASHEVECQPRFRLYLHTTSLPEEIPAEIAAFYHVLYFCQDKEGLAEQLLDRFVQKEKQRMKEDHLLLQQGCLENMEELAALEGRMLEILQSDITLLHNLPVAKKLSNLKQQHHEALEMKLKIAASEKAILRAREGFREIGVRGAVMLDTALMLRQLNSMYQISFKQLMELFDMSITHSERSSVKGVIGRLTGNVFSYVTKSLLEKDRLVYALLVAFEVEHSRGHINPGEKEFVISPDLCAASLQRLGLKPSEARQQTKNPFDWMSEEQFKNVQILAMYYNWFGDVFDRMCKDGKDLTWKTFCESEQPEDPAKVTWPEGLESLTLLQRLLVLRALRMDRILPSISGFISGTLGKTYVAEVRGDLQSSMLQASFSSPCLLIYSTDSDIPRKLFMDFAKRRSHKTLVFSVSNTDMAEKKIKEIMTHGMSEGYWVFLENIQNSSSVMTSVLEILRESKNPEKNFHLWLSAQAGPALPIRLLHHTVKIVVDTAMNIKGGLIQSWQLVDQETLGQSRQPEWPAILHNLCFLHCAARLRTQYGSTAGWNSRDVLCFGVSEFMEGLQLLKGEFKDEDLETGGKAIPWDAIRYLLSEIIYGRNVTDDSCLAGFTAMVDYWISPTAAKRGCELTKLKYKIPAAFFNSAASMTSLVQALEAIPQHSLDAPEAFHMHPSPAIYFGQDRYVFSQLKVLCDLMPLYDESKGVMAQDLIGSQKRRSACSVTSVTDLPSRTESARASDLLRHSQTMELWDICCSLIAKGPKGWNKDFINERLKKLGGNTPFNLFIKKELDQLMSLLSEVRRNLQAIKSATESGNSLGDQLSDTVMSVLNDLNHRRAPDHWCRLAGCISFPSEWSVSSWIGEVQQRVTHLEKILHLGQEKMPTYWLGAFSNPKGLLSILKQETIRRHSEQTGNMESIILRTEITQRDKDHIRDPPQEGMFIYGIYLWGVSWNKTDAELLDAPPQKSPCSLPVIHLHCLPMSEKTGGNDLQKASNAYACPVYISSASVREPVLYLDIHKENVLSSRWALRGMKATIHPF
ncbi:dynein gamma chain, flagellar outer arm-like [Rhinatrema bivittatum]|uniref:dynein gamma chain, flagellar outer arm-like n=1 Tax=Rhinatrema bivittatum TaxID=194408 RepID=UPI00112AC32E|nr:dynein gamma chain, flagellar outer arm-like [Rhinatrema bivittatum]